MNEPDFKALTEHGRLYAGFRPEDEAELLAAGPELRAHLEAVTDAFYEVLLSIPEARPFLEGRVERLRGTHHDWLERIFTGPYDEQFTQFMYNVGVTHVRVNLPVEFMACGITQIMNHLLPLLARNYGQDPARLIRVTRAVNAILGFCLIIMQESYQSSLLAGELTRFLKITGISRPLFNNLASAYRD